MNQIDSFPQVLDLDDDDETIFIKQYRSMPAKAPFRCPPPAPNFVGRQKELNQLLDNLKPAHVVTLCGAGGIGKSALAAQAVWQLCASADGLTPNHSPPKLFPDGILHHDFAEKPQVTQALSDIATAFGDDPQRGTPMTAAKRVLARRQALLVLDNTEHADDLSALLAVRGGCGVLMTSRRRKDALAKRLDLPPLELDEAVELLSACSKRKKIDIEGAQRICQLVGRWPFALCLIGCYLERQQEDINDYLKKLKQNILRTLHQGEQPLKSVPYFLSNSVAQVSPQAQEALKVVGILANAPFNREVVANLLQIPLYQVGRLLGELVNYGFLVRHKKPYEVTHRLIHTYAESSLALSDEQADKQLMERFIEYYYAFVQESRTKENPLAAIEAEYPHLLKALQRLRTAYEQEGHVTGELLINFVSALDSYWKAHNEDETELTWLTEAYIAACDLEQLVSQAKFICRLARLISKEQDSNVITSHIELLKPKLSPLEPPQANLILALMYSSRAFSFLSEGQVEQAKADIERILKIINELKGNPQVTEVYELIKQRTSRYQVDDTVLDLFNWWGLLWQASDSIEKVIESISVSRFSNNKAKILSQSEWFLSLGSSWMSPFLTSPHRQRREPLLRDNVWGYSFEAEEEHRIRIGL